MNTNSNQTRSMTVSTRFTPVEKVELQRLAEKQNTTIYDLVYTLAINFKDLYEYIGQDSPNETRLENELTLERKTVRKQAIELENAITKIELDAKNITKLGTEKHTLQIKIDEFSNELQKKKDEIFSLKQTILTLSTQDCNNVNETYTNMAIGLGSFISGLAMALLLPGFKKN